MALIGSITSSNTSITNSLGFTPLNRAGGTMTGTLNRSPTVTNNKLPITDGGIYLVGGSVTNNNTFQTVFGLRDTNVTTTGNEYSFNSVNELGGLISIYGEFSNAAVHALIAFSGKHLFGFSHLSILSSYAYNSAIQISGRDIQIRQAGDSTSPTYMRIITLSSY
jgi:hypothetical protein